MLRPSLFVMVEAGGASPSPTRWARGPRLEKTLGMPAMVVGQFEKKQKCRRHGFGISRRNSRRYYRRTGRNGCATFKLTH
jgi:hypothetical protein